MKATTDQQQDAKDKRELDEMTFRDFEEFFSTVDETISRRNKLLQKAYDLALDGDTQMLLFLLRKNFGKEVEKVDITSAGERLRTVVFPLEVLKRE